MYAVLDLETTGLFNRDRVIEVAIVHADERGEVTGTWHTLVNPERDLGRQDVHGVRAADARHAPLFGEIAGDIAIRMAGRIPVVHNIVFDSRLLAAEYARMGLDIPYLAEYGVCTMSWAAEFLPGTARGLATCCEAVGVRIEHEHEALADAVATAGLLRAYLGMAPDPAPWAVLAETAAGMEWPGLPYDVAEVRHRTRGDVPGGFVARIPRSRRTIEDGADEYLSAVDRALLDGVVSDTEAEGLVELAGAYGYGREQVLELHRVYLDTLAADGVDRAELGAYAAQLGLPGHAAEPRDAGLTRFALAPGDAIVLTGSFPEGKEYWAERARHAGLVVNGYVTKAAALVVAADPDSMSGKASTARRYGIPVVGPDGLRNVLSALAARL